MLSLTPPDLNFIPDQTGRIGTPLTLTFQATDADGPANQIGYLLDPDETPAGANVDRSSGVFTWTPTTAGVFRFVAIAIDTEAPPLADAEVFFVNVAAASDNQSPVNSVPGPATTNEDTALVFSTANGNAISISDPDAGTGEIEVALTVNNGGMTLASLTGLTITVGEDGDNESAITMRGALSAINTALAGLRFDPPNDFNGAAILTINTSDLGNTGAGGPKTDTDLVSIMVSEVNDAPSFTNGADVSVAEDAGLQSITAWATAILAGPTDEAGQSVTFEIVDNTNPALFSVAPTIAPDGTLSFTPVPNAFGVATISVRSRDTGGTANGGSDASTTQHFLITLTPVNDSPLLNTIPEKQGTVGNAVTFTATATDVDGDELHYQIQEVLEQPAGGNAASATIGLESGEFSFTPSGAGSYSFLISVADAGTPPLVDTIAFTFVVLAPNTAPSFVKGTDIAVPASAAPQSFANWATSISAGPASESGQMIDFVVTTDHPELFLIQPAISPAGTLTFTLADGAAGTATVTLRLHDNGGTSNGGQDTSSPETFKIVVTLDLAYRAHGLAFGPYIETGESPDNGGVTIAELEERLRAIANYTDWIRTYSATGVLAKAGEIIHALGKQGAIGAAIGQNPTSNQAEIDAVVQQAIEGDVDLVIVGNETLLRGDVSAQELVDYINQVKTRLSAAGVSVPVTTGDTYSLLLANPSVIAAVDVVCAYFYPFWEKKSVDIAIAELHRQYQQVVEAAGGKQVIVGETGWPSTGETAADSEAVPSPENAAYYFKNFVSWARALDVPYFYFEGIDERWKTNEGSVGPHWGVFSYDTSIVLKPSMDEVFDGQTIPDNWTRALGQPIIEFSTYPAIINTNVADFIIAGIAPHSNDVVKVNGMPVIGMSPDAVGAFVGRVLLQPGLNELTLSIESSTGQVLETAQKSVVFDSQYRTEGSRLLYVDVVPGEMITGVLDGTAVIDLNQNAVLGIVPGKHVRGVSPNGSEIYMDDKTVLSTSTHQVLRTLPFSQNLPLSGFVVSPDGVRIYSRDEVVDVLTNQLATLHLAVDITMGNSFGEASIPGGPAISSDGQYIYTGSPSGNPIIRVDTSNGASSEIDAVAVGAFLSDVAISPDGAHLLLSSYGGGSGVEIFDVATPGAPVLIPLADFMGEIAFLGDGTKAVVGSSGNPQHGGAKLALIDLNTMTLVHSLPIALGDNLTTSGLDGEIFVSTGNGQSVFGQQLGVDVVAIGQDNKLDVTKTYFLGINDFQQSTSRPRDDQIRRIVYKPAVTALTASGRSGDESAFGDFTKKETEIVAVDTEGGSIVASSADATLIALDSFNNYFSAPHAISRSDLATSRGLLSTSTESVDSNHRRATLSEYVGFSKWFVINDPRADVSRLLGASKNPLANSLTAVSLPAGVWKCPANVSAANTELTTYEVRTSSPSARQRFAKSSRLAAFDAALEQGQLSTWQIECWNVDIADVVAARAPGATAGLSSSALFGS